ncbi:MULTISPECIES: 2-hydroxyacyl-CoA dehydratase family protein [unclassified Microbacterium]|uniref:2-hydroxyacyl-CoA dehydratase family protein n=1 Tax=unclassified Microbacterium TaxID=2609290 RepID=UPI00214BD837|nr:MULTISPECIES: 2-hydroxyacyl-CoA dehydratase family protein [unclassified Microbacterium]MCR2786111.1 2-hydroxyacyl-CoA dehydratase family protein [Microbacterium sp. zg.B96]WIM17031.1 2-hydroxyacyl-CoA dehydratase family protein [Microbacterium sp. zg-B96]
MSRADAGPVITVVGGDVPRQLALAASALPRRLFGSWDGPIDPEAQELLGSADAVAARILTRLRAEPGSDAIVVCNDSQAHLRLFYALRAIGSSVPLHLIDLPRSDTPPARAFARAALHRFATFCSEVAGARIDSDSLAAAASAEREVGDALQRLRARRRAARPGCTGAAALDAYAAAATLPPREAVTRIDDATSAPVDRRRVHVTGSSHPDATVYTILERSGCLVVSEDHDTGDGALLGSAAAGDTLDTVIEGLLGIHFARTGGSATTSSAARSALTRETVLASGAHSAVALIRRGDEAPLWDLPEQRAELESLGLALHVQTGVAAGDAVAAGEALSASLRLEEVR